MSMPLKEYLKIYTPTTLQEDLNIIRQWAERNHMEQEMLKMISKLARSSLDRVEWELDYMKTWSPNTVDMYQVKGVTKEQAGYFNRLFQYVIAGVEPNDKMVDWLKENVPKMDCPSLFFVPASTYLAEMGIRFRNDDGKGFRDYDKRPNFRRM